MTTPNTATSHLKGGRIAVVIMLLLFAALWTLRADSPPAWKLTKESEALVTTAKLRGQIFRALDAAEKAGTDPHISRFKVRPGTLFEKDGQERVVLGGNTE